MNEQSEHLERVSSRIGKEVLHFCARHRFFRMDEMRKHIVATVGVVAPGSPDRILRDLRARGQIQYRVVNRRESFYEVLS